jgi:hydroxymethylglutaryl-CoA reductase (NADPH)
MVHEAMPHSTADNRSPNEQVLSDQKRLCRALEDAGLQVRGLVIDDFSDVYNRCCENILGYKKVPLGVSNRPVLINGVSMWIPLCTTEGALVASMCRGIKLINACGGVDGVVENLGITRGFTVRFKDFYSAVEFYMWMPANEGRLKEVGNTTSRFLRIKSVTSKHVIGDEVFIKVHAYTGDAMGMNMVTKACAAVAAYICEQFPGSETVCISSNTCTDKKWSMENFTSGRGRRVSLSMVLDDELCKSILKVGSDDLLKVYHTKIVVGSSLVFGSHNCQAANYVAALFLALGQDLGHVIESSNCTLVLKKTGDAKVMVSLHMPSVVVGVIGGGTHLEPSKSFLEQFRREDSRFFITDRLLDSGIAPNYLALTVAAAVLAGELSGLGALANNTLVDAHMRLNRK